MKYNVAIALLAAVKPAVGNVWVDFYSDDKCTQDKTDVSFNAKDDNCFSVGDRQYFKMHGSDANGCFSIVKSPEPGCNCQFDCTNVPTDQKGCLITIPDGNCHFIGQSASLRLVGGSCNYDNCQTKAALAQLEATPAASKANHTSGRNMEVVLNSQELASNIYEAGDGLGKQGRGIALAPRKDPGIAYFTLCRDEFCVDCSETNFKWSDHGCINGDGYKSMYSQVGSNNRVLARSDASGCGDSECKTITQNVRCTRLSDYGLDNAGSYHTPERGEC
ncbi:hypothetical protein V2A60_009278 [Cordyceps javanica]